MLLINAAATLCASESYYRHHVFLTVKKVFPVMNSVNLLTIVRHPCHNIFVVFLSDRQIFVQQLQFHIVR